MTVGGRSAGSQVRIGLQLPQGYFNEFDGWEPARAWRRILDIARLGERLGFESVWLGEHVLSKWGGHRSIAFDCFVLASAVAASVPSVGLGFDIVNSTFRNPALTAKMAATLDAVSDGRVILGLGCGFKPLEASTYGFEYPAMKERLAVLAEHLEIITRMLDNAAEPFSYDGNSAHVEGMDASPRSSGRRRMPIMVAGRGKEITFRLAAKYADILNLGTQLQEAPDFLPWARQRCEEIGRDPDTLEFQAAINASVKYRGLTEFGGQRMMEPHEFGFTDPKYLLNVASRAEEIAGWRDLGADEIVVAVPGLQNTDDTIHAAIEDIRAAGIEFPRAGRTAAASTPAPAAVPG